LKNYEVRSGKKTKCSRDQWKTDKLTGGPCSLVHIYQQVSLNICSYLPKYSTIKYQKIITLQVNGYWLFHLVSEQKSIKGVEIREGICSTWRGGGGKTYR
jgi:hypothetical protein